MSSSEDQAVLTPTASVHHQTGGHFQSLNQGLVYRVAPPPPAPPVQQPHHPMSQQLQHRSPGPQQPPPPPPRIDSVIQHIRRNLSLDGQTDYLQSNHHLHPHHPHQQSNHQTQQNHNPSQQQCAHQFHVLIPSHAAMDQHSRHQYSHYQKPHEPAVKQSAGPPHPLIHPQSMPQSPHHSHQSLQPQHQPLQQQQQHQMLPLNHNNRRSSSPPVVPELPVKLRPKNLDHGSSSYLVDGESDFPPPPSPPLPPPAVLHRHHPSFDLGLSLSLNNNNNNNNNLLLHQSHVESTHYHYHHHHHHHHQQNEDWRDSRCSSWSGKQYSFSCPSHLCQHLQQQPPLHSPSSPTISVSPDPDTDAHPLSFFGPKTRSPSSSRPDHQQPQQQQESNFVPTPASLITSFNGLNVQDPGKPPLPPKKRSVMEYMQMVGTYGGPSDTALSLYRNSMQAHHSHSLLLQQQTSPNQLVTTGKSASNSQQTTAAKHFLHLSSQVLRHVDSGHKVPNSGMSIGQQSLDSRLSASTDSSLSTVSSTKSSSGCESMISRNSGPQNLQHYQEYSQQEPPPLPSKSKIGKSVKSPVKEYKVPNSELVSEAAEVTGPPPPLPPKTFQRNKNKNKNKDGLVHDVQLSPERKKAVISPTSACSTTVLPTPEPSQPTSRKSSANNRIVEEAKHLLSTLANRGLGSLDGEEEERNLLQELDVSEFLILKPGDSTNGLPEIRGGTPDALLVKAAEVTQHEFLFQEAFLATFRTFVTPQEVVDKLLFRYNKFISSKESGNRQKVARNAFVLLVRVVDDLCVTECTDELINALLTFVCQLVQRGDHTLAKVLRNKTMEKMESRKAAEEATVRRVHLPSISVSTKVRSLLDFKSQDLAEQMTIIDSRLFAKVEVAEALVWAREQREEVIPNLTKFTEHFNNMSYWVRSQILRPEEAKEREKICLKFIKVMRSLKKLANFNSIFAILSALDSAPIRRLDWPRGHADGMRDFASLIDSSSSFRAYRQVLADTLPPCIPYIGLILQDLTFVHIGNDDLLPDGNVNFSKRWLQFNILDQMRRFRNSHYPLLKRNEEIINFFDNFEDYLHEESLWQISESIKPRGGKK